MPTFKNSLSIWISLIVGLFLTLTIVYIASKDVVERKQQSFQLIADNIGDEAASYVNAVETDLKGLRTFFHVSLSVERDQFRLYTNDVLQKHDLLKEVYYLPLILEEDRKEFVDNMRDIGYPTYKIYEFNEEGRKKRVETKEQYFPVEYLEPLKPQTAKMLGFDFSSSQKLNLAMKRAIASGETISLQNASIFKEDIILLVATYAGKSHIPESEAERIRAANGVIVFRIKLDPLHSRFSIGSDNHNTQDNTEFGHQKAKEQAKKVNITFQEQTQILLGNEDDLRKAQEIKKRNLELTKTKFIPFGKNVIEITSRTELAFSTFLNTFTLISSIGGIFFTSLLVFYSYTEVTKHEKVKELVKLRTQELHEKNRDLSILNSSMRAILESLGPALLFFNKDGLCSDTYSNSCLSLLECNPGHKSISEVLKLNEDEKQAFSSLSDFAFSNESAMNFRDIFEIAPSNFKHSQDKIIKLDYRPIYDNEGELENILVIAVDKTQEEETKNIIREKEQQAAKIMSMTAAKKDFVQTLRSIHSYFLRSDKPSYSQENSITSLKSSLHTLKGLSGSFSLIGIADLIHKMEDAIVDINKADKNISLELAINKIERYIPALKECFEEEVVFSESILGYEILETGEMKNVSYQNLFSFYDLLKEKEAPHIAEQYYSLFLTIPIFEALKFLDIHLQDVAHKLNKKIAPCVFEGENLAIPLNHYDDLFYSFIHIVRNAADHGIETPGDREVLDKEESASFSISIQEIKKKNQSFIEIIFKDDGSGIDIQKIKDKLHSKNINTENLSKEDIMMKIFDDEISSKDEVSDISGRGVGLSAVKEQVEALNGNIKVQSDIGIGTAITITIAYKKGATATNQE